MAWQPPTDPMEALRQQLASRPQDPNAPANGMQPANGMPGAAPGATPGAMPGRVPPAAGMPTDDPGIAMPAMPTPPDYSKLPIGQELEKAQGLQTQLGQLNPPKREDYKPALWKRIVSGVAGGVAPRFREGLNDLTWGKFNRAEADYESQRGKLNDQLNYERGIAVPLAESASRLPQQNFENQMQVTNANRSWAELQRQNKRDQMTADWHNEANDIRQMIGQGKLEEGAKKIEQLTQHYQDMTRLYGENLDIKQQLADLKAQATGKGSGNQFAGLEQKKQAALGKAHSEYVKATRNLPQDPKAVWSDEDKATLQNAQDDFREAQQQAQNAYEAEINSLGGTASHYEYPQAGEKPGAAQPSAPATAPATGKPADSTSNAPKRKPGDMVTYKGKARDGLVPGKQYKIKNIRPDGNVELE